VAVATYQDLFWRVSCGRTREVGRRCSALAWQDTAHHHEVVKWTHSLLAAPLRTDDQLELPVPSMPACTTPVPQPLLKFGRILRVPVNISQNGECMELNTNTISVTYNAGPDHRDSCKSSYMMICSQPWTHYSNKSLDFLWAHSSKYIHSQ
jgi:hypothetical protein